MNLTTRQISFILEVAKTRNFNRAAENQFVSQPTISYQIRLAEDALGFRIFDRTGKGASLTPAGAQFCATLSDIASELKTAVEQGQNISSRFTSSLRIALPIRSALPFLPEAIERFGSLYPKISVTPVFNWYHGKDLFLKGEADILFALKEEMRRVPDISEVPLFESGIYLVVRSDDPLAKKKLTDESDLRGRTLLVGGGSPAPLRSLQQRLIEKTRCDYFNSADHDTTLTLIAARKAVVLAPGFLNDRYDHFAWVPFKCPEKIPCALYIRENDAGKPLKDFTRLLIQLHTPRPGYQA